MVEKKLIICLDAGHYAYYNLSPANKNYYESIAMWKLTMLQKKYLEMLGFEVILTRDKQEVDLALTERGMKSTGCVLFLSNHSNAVGSYVNEDVDYSVAYALTEDNTTKIDEISKEIGALLTQTVTEVMGLKQEPRVTTRLSDTDRNSDGVLNDNYYGVLNGARLVGTPGIILEHSFHTNTKSTNWLLDDDNLDKLAKAEAEALAKYFGVVRKEEPVQETKALRGTVKVTYTGADGLNVRKVPSMGDNVVDVVHGGTYTVVGISVDGDWYKLESGLFITANPAYVVFGEEVEVFKPYMVKIDVDKIYDHCLNVREKPNANPDTKIMYTVMETMSVTIVDEAIDEYGNIWGLLLSYQEKRDGWIRLDYTQR